MISTASVRETGTCFSLTSLSSCKAVNSTSPHLISYFCPLYVFKINKVKQTKSCESVWTVSSSIVCSLKTWTQIRKAGRPQPAPRSRWVSTSVSSVLWVVTTHWWRTSVSDRDKLMIWWRHWWNALRTISAVSNLTRQRGQKTGRRAGIISSLWNL